MEQNLSPMKHVWNFASIGGVKRVSIESGSDLKYLHELDQKLWTALSCPVDDLEIDNKTLELIDTDNDGHIRVPEILDAVGWILSAIKNPNDLLTSGAEMPLSAIDENTEAGKALLDSARIILKNLGKEDATFLTADDTADLEKIFKNTPFNGDGIITDDSTAGAHDLTESLNNIINCCGSVTDRGGKQGVNEELVAAFFAECEKHLVWYQKSEAAHAAVFPLGDKTAAAYGHYKAVSTKVEDYFLRCRLAAFDKQSTEVLNLQTDRVKTITEKSLPGCVDEIAGYPLATVGAGNMLPLTIGVNPAWEGAMDSFKEHVVLPLTGNKETLSEADWKKIAGTFAAYEQWYNEQEGVQVASLGLTRIKELLSGDVRTQLMSLVNKDKSVAAEATNIILVDKLVRYYRDLFTLLRNFVTFSDFYSPEEKAIFQAGTLYIDQRSCDLCVKVRDMAKQGELAMHSGMYLIYCECVSKATNAKMTIVAALTNGDVDDLMVGRNAVFYDRDGLDWNATIIKITENPTSIRQAFFAPYRKVSRFVENQINKAASAADEKSNANLTKGVSAVPAMAAEEKPKKETTQAFDVAKFAGIFAAMGLALGAIGSTITAIVTGFLNLVWWQMPLAIMGTLLVISGPSMILAYLKLRKRNLSPILDANGWAINAQLKVNIHFGRTLTHLAELPDNAKVNFNDPFVKKQRPFLPILLSVVVVIAVVFYFLWKAKYFHLP